MSGIDVFFAIYNLLLAIKVWFGFVRTVRLYGRVPWRAMGRMLVYLRHSPKRYLYFWGAAAPITLGIAVFFGDVAMDRQTAVHLAVWLEILIALHIAAEAQPPATILLTNSHPRSAELFRIVRRAIYPLRAVALLSYRSLSPFQFGDCFYDNLRTGDGRMWKGIVHQLIDIVPVVMMDARPDAEPVKDEAFMMLAPQRAGRGLFLVGPRGECPALRAHGIDPEKNALRTATEETVVEVLRDMLATAASLPPRRAEAAPLKAEDWENLPSMAMYPLGDDFDSADLVAHAVLSGQDVVIVPMPWALRDEGNGAIVDGMRKGLWEFLHDRRLAIFQLGDDVVLIRIAFLAAEAPTLPVFRTAGFAGRVPTWEELNQPSQVLIALDKFVAELRRRAERRNLSFRRTA